MLITGMSLTLVREHRLRQQITDVVQRVERKLHPEVIRIRYSLGDDWSGDPAIFFRIVIADEVMQRGDLAAFVQHIGSEISADLRREEVEPWPYFNFRTISDQEQSKSPEWE